LFFHFYPNLNSLDLKENGTIPFYGRFLKKVFIREFRELTRITKEESRKAVPSFQKWNSTIAGCGEDRSEEVLDCKRHP
jgi:hypothetical protein